MVLAFEYEIEDIIFTTFAVAWLCFKPEDILLAPTGFWSSLPLCPIPGSLSGKAFRSPSPFVAGDLISRHMQVFKSNEFFCGVVLPEPQEQQSLEQKMGKTLNNIGMDFLKVGTGSVVLLTSQAIPTLSFCRPGFRLCSNIEYGQPPR